MKIFYLPAYGDGSYHYRYYLPAKYLQGMHETACKHFSSIIDMRDYDMVIMQARANKYILWLLKALGKTIVAEIDDNLWEIPHGNESRNFWTPDKLRGLEVMLELSNAVITTTKPLADIVSKFNRNVHVIPNYIEDVNSPKPPLKLRGGGEAGGVIRIGYAGSLSHAPDFEEGIIKALKDIKKRYREKVQLVFLGYMPEELKDIAEYHPYVPPLVFMDKLRSLAFDIGIIPCAINNFNHCKSNLKFLEYSIVGAATIASLVYPYIETIYRSALFPGFISDNSNRSWFNSLSLLIDSEQVRIQTAALARSLVRENYLIKDKINAINDVYKSITKRKGVML